MTVLSFGGLLIQALQAYAEKRMQEAKKAGGGSGRKDANDAEVGLFASTWERRKLHVTKAGQFIDCVIL